VRKEGAPARTGGTGLALDPNLAVGRIISWGEFIRGGLEGRGGGNHSEGRGLLCRIAYNNGVEGGGGGGWGS